MKKLFVLVAMLGMAFAAQASDLKKIEQALEKVVPPGAKPTNIAPVKGTNLYEAIYDGQILYITADGKFLLQGDLFDLENRLNLTEERRSDARKQVISGIDSKDMIVFSPKKVKHSVTIFTDVDCGYCRKLHKEMDDYLDLGIQVRYLAYPRAGEGSPTYNKMVSVWCAGDRNEAMTAAKTGGRVEEKECKNHPVDKHVAAARKVGVSGTPTIVMDNGNVIPGYVPAQRLLNALTN